MLDKELEVRYTLRVVPIEEVLDVENFLVWDNEAKDFKDTGTVRFVTLANGSVARVRGVSKDGKYAIILARVEE